MKLSNIRSIDGGTNALVLKATFDEKDVIIKQYGFERKINSKAPRINKDIFEDLYTDSLELRQKVQKNNVKTPRIITHYYANDSYLYKEIGNEEMADDSNKVRLITMEEYCGISFKELILSKSLSIDEINKFAEIIENLICSMPLDAELDTAPSNFTFLNEDIFFVDFMPPKIVGYRNNEKLRDLFPRIAERTNEREERRIRRYTTTEGRKERFNIYLDETLKQEKFFNFHTP